MRTALDIDGFGVWGSRFGVRSSRLNLSDLCVLLCGSPLIPRDLRSTTDRNLVFLRGFYRDELPLATNRARMAKLGLMDSRAPGIVQDQNAPTAW